MNSQLTEAEEEYSDRDVDSDGSSLGIYESWYDKPPVPREMSTWGMQGACQQWEAGSSMITESDARDFDICNLADFSSDEEDTPVLEMYGCPDTNVDTVPNFLPDLSGQCDAGSSVITRTDGGDYDICNLADFSSDEEDVQVLDSNVCSDINVDVVTELSPGLSEECDASSSMLTETDGGGYDVCNLADFSSDNDDTSTEGESGCPDIHFGEITQLSYEFSDLEDSDWEYEPDAICRRAVEYHNFDLIDGMTPRVFVPTPREDRRSWPKIDLIYRPRLWVLTNEECAPVIHTDSATVPSNTVRSAPIGVEVTVPLYKESVGNVDSPLRKRTDSCSIILQIGARKMREIWESSQCQRPTRIRN